MNLFMFMEVFSQALSNPFSLRWKAHTPKFLIGALAVYMLAIAYFYSNQQNRRPGVEHGSAHWGNVRELNRKYSDKDPGKNVILTQHLQMSLNARQHFRNLLQIIVGGSGAGKSRSLILPNLLLGNASFIVTDPKGELLRSVGAFLLKRGYVLRVFDLIDPSHSNSYNPFRYIRKDSDVFRLIDNFIKNTTPKNASQNDPFWEKSEIALDSALMLYLLHEAPPEEQNMEMMLTMIEYGGAKEDDDDFKSPLDLLFEALEEEQPGHIAVRQYKIFKQAAGKTAKSILVGAAVRLASFTLPEIQNITAEDTLEIGKMGERKQAIFCIIPDSNDTSLNFLVGMLYTQALVLETGAFSARFFSLVAGTALGAGAFNFSPDFFSAASGSTLGSSAGFFSPAAGAVLAAGAFACSTGFFAPTEGAALLSGIFGGEEVFDVGAGGVWGTSPFCGAPALGMDFVSGMNYLLQVSRNEKYVPTWDALHGSAGYSVHLILARIAARIGHAEPLPDNNAQ